ncbi:MAG: esterase-like activity of phytase family protein, partial [Flavobacteriales bacterium]
MSKNSTSFANWRFATGNSSIGMIDFAILPAAVGKMILRLTMLSMLLLAFLTSRAQITLVQDYENTVSATIGTFQGINFREAGFSGLCAIPGTNGKEFWTVSDRGVNVDGANANLAACRPTYDKIYGFPNYVPKIHRIRLNGTSVEILQTITMKRPGGSGASGLLNPTGFGSTAVEVVSTDTVQNCANFSLKTAAKDQWGIDSEGIVVDGDGNFWICEEGGPTIWKLNPNGVVINRFTPYANQIGSSAIDIQIDSVFEFRKNNRGFEGIAITPNGKIYAFIQSPLLFPNTATGESTRIHRILEIDPTTNANQMFVYLNDGIIGASGPNQIRLRDWKIGDAVAINNTQFLVLEAAARGTSDIKRLYQIDISGATPVTGGLYSGVTLEALVDATGLGANGITPVTKTLFMDLLANGWNPALDKAEGLTIIDANTIAIGNDNDYGQISVPQDGVATATGKTSHVFVYSLAGANAISNYVPGPATNNGVTGISTTTTPYLLPSAPGAQFTSVLTVGDQIGGYKMVGIPDGMGAFDNGDGTFTLLLNHELGNAAGVVRAHGSLGSFVSKWTINKSNLQVQSGSDLIQTPYFWNTTTNSYDQITGAYSRFCSGDLPAVSAFYNAATGLGSQERIYMNGEETGNEGRAFAHIATGPNAGKSYQLPRLGRLSYENSLANPASGNSTVVVSTDDTTPGQVYVYIGTKTNSGNEIERAGLTNGNLYGVIVSGLFNEVSGSYPAAGTPFSLFNLGNVENVTGATLQSNSVTAGITNFLRPEDGNWDPSNPNDFYFVTTNNITSPSRLWRLRFTDITNPTLGGTVEVLLDGTEGQKMLDNMTLDNYGHVIMQEDVGNNVHIGKVWQYTIATDQLKEVGAHDEYRFISGAPGFLTQDEESSGVIDMQSILGPGMFMVNVQAHYPIPGELAEGGQLLAFYNPDTFESSEEIAVAGNSQNIADGDLAASTNDNTDFGGVFIGTPVAKPFVISNTGSTGLTINAISFGGLNPGLFSLVSPPSFPVNVAAGSSLTINVQFAPVASDYFNAEIIITNTDYSEGTFNFALKGTGLLPGVVAANSSSTPYLLPTVPNAQFTSILTVGDQVGSYKMVGIPDGLGAYDNNDGTFSLLMNHELGNTAGVVRDHGSIGSFVSKWIINKNNLSVVSGSDLIQTAYLWNTTTSSYELVTPIFSRFCSADLPPVSAFYNPQTGLGTQERIYMNGEETGPEGRAFGHILTGSNEGVSYQLPRLGRLSYENQLASPFTGDKTVVVSTDDATPGQVYVYIGTKTSSGTEIERAGLTNGSLYGITVAGLINEVSGSYPAPGTAFSLVGLGNVENMTGAALHTASVTAGITNFLRPEDGSWDPSQPNDFYFATTNSFSAPSRLWKLHFTDILNPELGGTVEVVLDGTEGQKMVDNMTIDGQGFALLQEDVGNNAHIGKIWQYNTNNDQLKQVAQHDPNRFITGAPSFLTQDEESSGIIDVQSILGAGMFICNVQAHYPIPGELAEGGQLLAFFNPDTYNASEEINVAGITIFSGGVNINDGDMTPTTADNTNFGTVNINSSANRQFAVYNSGSVNLTITGVDFGGANGTEFSLLGAPAFPWVIAPNGTQNFVIRFSPVGLGERNAVVTIYNTDPTESSFDFAVKGTSVCTPLNTYETITACDSYDWNGSSYTTSGTYSFVDTNEQGCPVNETLYLTIKYSTTSEVKVVACDSYEWNGTVYTQSGFYQFISTNEQGCQHTAILDLTINYSSSTYTEVTACDSYEWFGTSYTASGTYTNETTNEVGCTHIDTLVLTINYSTYSTDAITACESYEWNGSVYSNSGVYYFESTNEAGCTHYQTLELTINYGYYSTEYAQGCDSYEWNGNVYTESGTYYYNYENEYGCPSVITLELYLGYTTYQNIYATACDSYEWNGEILYYSGDYSYTLPNQFGCDEIITLHLTINYSTYSTDVVTACESYDWNGSTYYSSGTYSYESSNEAGCTHYQTLELTINYGTFYTEYAQGCDSYEWNGNVYTESGTYYYNYENEYGCPSVITLELYLGYTTYQNIYATACDSYEWNGEILYYSGDYSYTLPNQFGCDEIITLHLTINNSTSNTTAVTACDSYEWFGSLYYESGVYSYVTTNEFGCTHTEYLELTINYSTTSTTDVTACDSYEWYGNVYTGSGVYSNQSTNEFGCTYTEYLNLTINYSTSSYEY